MEAYRPAPAHRDRRTLGRTDERVEHKFCGEGKVQFDRDVARHGASYGSQELVSGTALVLPEFRPDASFKDKVLVTRQTDPGWTIVFPFVKALVVERGGILSHAAIVAREFGIPCIVGVENATDLIDDGGDCGGTTKTGRGPDQPGHSSG